jgi:hypothetical protein
LARRAPVGPKVSLPSKTSETLVGREGPGGAEGVPPVEDVGDPRRQEIPVRYLEDPLDAEPLRSGGKEPVVRAHEEGPPGLDNYRLPLAPHGGVDDADVDRPLGEVGGAPGHVEGPLVDAVVPDVVADVDDGGFRQYLEDRSLHLGDVGVLDPVVRQEGYDRHCEHYQVRSKG